MITWEVTLFHMKTLLPVPCLPLPLAVPLSSAHMSNTLAVPVFWHKCSIQWTWSPWPMWQGLGCWTSLNLRQGLSITIPNFCHIIRAVADWTFRLEVLGVLQDPGTELLSLATLLPQSGTLAAPTERQSPSGKQPWQPWVHTRALLVLWGAQEAHTPTAAAFLLSGAESPWEQQRFQAPGVEPKHFRWGSSKKHSWSQRLLFG